MKTINQLLIFLAITILSGCQTFPFPETPSSGSSSTGGSAVPDPETAKPAEPEPQVNREMLEALDNVAALEEEVKELRNLVEVQQFELDNLKKRQRELYDDLDLRVRRQERSATSIPEITLPQPVSADGEVDEATLEGADTGGTVDTVLVTPSEPAGDPLAEQEAYDNAFDLLKQSRYEDAIAAFQSLIEENPNSEFADDAHYWIGEANYVTREFDSSLVAFQSVLENYPESQRVPDAMLKVGYIHYETQNYNEARRTLIGIINRFPGNRVAVSADARIQKMNREGL